MPQDYGAAGSARANGNGYSAAYGNDERDSLLPHDHAQSPSWSDRLKARLSENIDVEECGAGLLLQCMIAGVADAAAYNQTTTWAAFMTGNLTQLIMAATTVAMTRPAPEAALHRLADSMSAVVGFIIGSFVAMLVDKSLGARHRGKFVGWALARALVFLALAPAIAYFGWEGTSGMVILFIMAFCMGSMAVNASKLGSTPYATTVVFTSTLASVFSDPLLPFGLSRATAKRGLSIVALLVGGAASQATMLGVTRLTGHETHPSSLHAMMPNIQPLGSAISITGVALIEIAASICWLRTKRKSPEHE